jgi:hypothetical protein
LFGPDGSFGQRGHRLSTKWAIVWRDRGLTHYLS